MSHNPVPTDGRKILETRTVDKSSDWWTGVVRDRDPDTGETRVRLERETRDNRSGQWKNVHVWRVRPEFWDAEITAIDRIENGYGSSPPRLPLDETLTARRYIKVRRDERRWVAAVQVDSDHWWDSKTRLYHWSADCKRRCQSWTAGKYWAKTQKVASHMMEKSA